MGDNVFRRFSKKLFIFDWIRTFCCCCAVHSVWCCVVRIELSVTAQQKHTFIWSDERKRAPGREPDTHLLSLIYRSLSVLAGLPSTSLSLLSTHWPRTQKNYTRPSSAETAEKVFRCISIPKHDGSR